MSVLAIPITVLLLIPAEYLVHRLLMHHETPLAPAAYDRHAVQHHRLGRNDVNIDVEPWYLAALASPALVLLMVCGLWREAAWACLTIGLYSLLWTGLHRSFHGVGGSWACRLPFHGALERHHLGHHARPGRNFGAVFGPALDIPLGTHRDD